jgi:hypothetical protein
VRRSAIEGFVTGESGARIDDPSAAANLLNRAIDITERYEGDSGGPLIQHVYIRE